MSSGNDGISKDLPILVLAGGKISPEMQATSGETNNRALIRIHGQPMLEYVLSALSLGRDRAGYTGRLLVAGKGLPLPDNATALPDGVSLVDTLLNGVAALDASETRLLVSTADIPFLTPDAVVDLIHRATNYPSADFIYPIINAAVCKSAFPGMRRTTLQLAEGTFTGGNLVILNPSFLRENETALRTAYANRKDIVGLARMLGGETLLRLLFSRVLPSALPISSLEKAVGKLLGGATANAIITPYPEIGADVDRPEDIPIANQIIAERLRSPITP